MKSCNSQSVAQRKTILIVDQDPGMRLMLTSLLQSAEHRAVGAADYQEALDRLDKSGPVHLVVSEMQLPQGNGLKLLRDIRQYSPEIPVVFITESDEIELYLTAMDEGAFDYLPKPLQIGDILRVIHRALAAPRPVPQREYVFA